MTKDKKTKKDQTQEKESPEKKAEKGKVKNGSSKKPPGKKETVKTLKEDLAVEKDRVLRLSAEFENYKKRKQRELDDFKKFANETVFRQLLSVVDNLERAISAAEDNSDESGLLEGVKLTYKEIIRLLESFSVKSVDAENQAFDPNFHQAVTQVESDKHPENTVTSVLQKGYLLHDRLIRPAMVVVSKRAEKETEQNKEN